MHLLKAFGAECTVQSLDIDVSVQYSDPEQGLKRTVTQKAEKKAMYYFVYPLKWEGGQLQRLVFCWWLVR